MLATGNHALLRPISENTTKFNDTKQCEFRVYYTFMVFLAVTLIDAHSGRNVYIVHSISTFQTLIAFPCLRLRRFTTVISVRRHRRQDHHKICTDVTAYRLNGDALSK